MDQGVRECLHQRPRADSLAVDEIGFGANLADALGRERQPGGHVLVVLTDDVHGHALSFDRPELTKEEQDVEDAGVPVVRAQPYGRLSPEDDRGVYRVLHDHRRKDRRGRGVARDVPQPHALVPVPPRVAKDGYVVSTLLDRFLVNQAVLQHVLLEEVLLDAVDERDRGSRLPHAHDLLYPRV